MRTSWREADGSWRTALRGRAVFADPRINKGTAFPLGERRALGLLGLLPHRVMTIEAQVSRSYAQFSAEPDDLAKNVFLTALHDRNEVLYYRLLVEHLREMLPIVYTPTVAVAIQRYSHLYRRPRGVYLSVDSPELIESSLAATGFDPGEVDVLVATDSEAILGIGDWGVGGMAIAEGKLVVYSAAGGIDPFRTLPVVLDVGTNREDLLADPLYLGNPHPRVDQDTYDAFLDAYVAAASRRFPGALLHWEDFGPANAHRILDRYRDRLPTFNDDIQGTGAVNLGAVLAGVRASGRPLAEHRMVIFGAGSAGIGIADQLRRALRADGLDDAAARARIWCLDRQGLLTTATTDLRPHQRPFARPAAEVAGWPADPALGGIGLPEVVERVRPTVLVGTSTRRGAFDEPVVRTMARATRRPIILPMSNPTELAEATPADLLAWTDGRALVATGSPFPPVRRDGVSHVIGQANNALVFPGIGLGAVVAKARLITDGMLLAAARAVAELVDLDTPGAPLLPPVDELRATSLAVATAVVEAAVADGVATAALQPDHREQVRRAMWQPEYRRLLPG